MFMLYKLFGGANEITKATHACILTIFVTVIWENILNILRIFLKSLQKSLLKIKIIFSYYFIKVHV
jgi:hypothetical protein